jgi:hypothetical protein
MRNKTVRPERDQGRGARARTIGCCTAAVVCGWLLVACSHSAAPPTAASAPAPRKQAARAPAPGSQEDTDAKLVSAVGPSASSQPIQVKFRILARPTLGVPLQILVSVTPVQDVQINHIQGSFLPDGGLKLQSDRSFDQDDVREALQRTVTVVPQQPGVLNVNATFTLEVGDRSVSCSYAIPVIVSDNS